MSEQRQETASHAPDPHAIAAQRVLDGFGVDLRQGLSRSEAEQRLAEIGPNELPENPPPPFWKRLLAQLRGTIMFILFAAIAISAVLGDWVEAGVIFAIVVLNAVVGALQEARAERALQGLKELSAPTARVIRGGTAQTIPARTLVPGDIVLLEAGSIIPADLRLLETARLRVDESSLTGESVPVEKDAEAVLDPSAGIADRINCAFSGATVTYGRGRGIVIATGTTSELGKIAAAIEQPEEATPLQRKLEEFGRVMGIGVLIVCALVFAVGIVRSPQLTSLFGDGFGTFLSGGREVIVGLFVVAVSLAVAAVPEGLPAVVTMSLALGTRKMLQRNALVRRLASVETLGAATIICTDKTGTLTQNRMTVTDVWTLAGAYQIEAKQDREFEGDVHHQQTRVEVRDHPELRAALLAGFACNDAEWSQSDGNDPKLIGDPTETALVVAARRAGLTAKDSERQRIGEIPFDSTRKRMTTIHRAADLRILPEDNGTIAVVKGAPDSVLPLCTRGLISSGPNPLSDPQRDEILQANQALGEAGKRVLAMATRTLTESDGYARNVAAETIEADLTFLGLVAMQDPPRPEVAAAVERAKSAGLRSVMITGDHVTTAAAIGGSIGILRPEGAVVEGGELEAMSDEELRGRVDAIDVFARVSPHHKVRIVEALRANDHVVAMTGDGVNDAPALKAADIGIAMGITGTDVAKQTADMVLTDDNYASIVAAVEQGRIIYANIRKTITYLLSCNVAEIAILFLATLLGWPPPLTAIQLLWLNLATDGAPALALAMEPGEAGIMSRPPRSPLERILNRRSSTSILFQAGLLTAVVLAAFGIARSGSWGPAAGTLAFATLAIAELVRAYAARSEKVPLTKLGWNANRWMHRAVLSSLALVAIVLYIPPLQSAFGTMTASAPMWGMVLPLALLPAVAIELRKRFVKKISS